MKFIYETDRLILRVLDGTSAAEVLRFYLDNRELFERYEPERTDDFYTEHYQRRLLNYEYNLCLKLSAVRFWVFENTNPYRIIGTVCFRDIIRNVYQCCELGYKFDPRYWHHGYAAESIRQCIDLIFGELSLHRIVLNIMPENTASIQLATHLGFQPEGIARKSARIRGVWEDHAVYSLINPADEAPFM